MSGGSIRAALPLTLLTAAVGLVLLSPYFAAPTAPAWLRVVGAEVQAACRDPGTQWMVVVCLVSYFVVFLFLETKSKAQGLKSKASETHTSPRPSPLPAGPEREKAFAFLAFFRGHIGNPNIWLVGCLSLGLLRYAVDYETAARSMLPLVLVAGVLFGKGVALWAAWPASLKANVQSLKLEEASRHLTPALSPLSGNTSSGCATFSPSDAEKEIEAERVSEPSSILHVRSSSRRRTVLAIFTFLLGAAALWQPELGMEFQYRGLPRWSGAWENPNLYGLLMGVGVVLAIGQIVLSLKCKSRLEDCSRRREEADSYPERRGDDPPRYLGGYEMPATRNAVRWLWLALLIAAAGLCGFGLLKSFSRGAWLGTAVGLGFLMLRWINHEIHQTHEKPTQKKFPSFLSCRSCGSWFRSNWLPASVILSSVLVLAFWQFRHTENPVVRRAFSVGNPNDFSWRNRVAAWQGAGRMMLDKPLLGFGWGKAEQVYREQYRAARLEDSAAIQMNDYLMLGISCGVPALVCFVGYVFFASRGPRVERRGLAGLEPLARITELGSTPAPGVAGRAPRPASSAQTCHEPSENSDFSARARKMAPGADALPVQFRSAGVDFNLQPSAICLAGALVLLVGFWFDGGLFKLPTATVFWVLFELSSCRRRGDETQISSVREESVRAFSRRLLPLNQWQIALRCLAGLLALGAGGLTALHLVTPQLAITERTLAITRNHLLTPKARADFDYLAAQPGWAGQPVRTLRQHAELANYNRHLVGWKLDDELYREFVLSPVIDSSSGEEFHWRRELWESFYPRIRKESNMQSAAEIVARFLGSRVTIVPGEKLPDGVESIWARQRTDEVGFEKIHVAALRAVGIPARLNERHQAEFFADGQWQRTPLVRPKVPN
jgi:O-antigen ligase